MVVLRKIFVTVVHPGCARCQELLFWTKEKMACEGEYDTKKDGVNPIRQVCKGYVCAICI